MQQEEAAAEEGVEATVEEQQQQQQQKQIYCQALATLALTTAKGNILNSINLDKNAWKCLKKGWQFKLQVKTKVKVEECD